VKFHFDFIADKEFTHMHAENPASYATFLEIYTPVAAPQMN
jgi:hypothetical protein